MIKLSTQYNNKLSLIDTEKAIKLVKDTFENQLAKNLNLIRVSAPLFVEEKSGLNDNLNGVEKPVGFKITKIKKEVEIVQSLAKWKRMALGKYRFDHGVGLYTDMNAVRPDEELDNLHSIYVDQWDWEKVISKEERNIDYLKKTVKAIVKTLADTNKILKNEYPVLSYEVTEDVHFITSEELLQLYPNNTPKEREDLICKEYKTVFVIGIGNELSNGVVHDLRAPDYDDWRMNGDILVWYPLYNRAVELSSMGIRVDEESLYSQLEKNNKLDRLGLPFHKSIMNKELPLTIGGGIGQSRVCLVLLEKAHIAEVQASTWKEEDVKELTEMGAYVL